MAAARLDAALWELHRPLAEAPAGEDPSFAVSPARLVTELGECLEVEGVETSVAQARLFCNEHPPDACRWLAASKSFKLLETPRTNVLKLIVTYIRKHGAGPHALKAFASLRAVFEGRGHATTRQAAASALRALCKNDTDRDISGEAWRDLSHKCVDALGSEKAKGVRGESLKLASMLIASEYDAPSLAPDARCAPWDEQGASLLRFCKIDLQKEVGKDSGATLAALEHLCANGTWAPEAAEVAAPAVVLVLEKYIQNAFTLYEAPAKALRFLRRRATTLAAALPPDPLVTYAPIQVACSMHPGGGGTLPTLVSKHAAAALVAILSAQAQRNQGDWAPVFVALLHDARNNNPRVRAAALRSIAAAAPAAATDFAVLMEATNACADACDAQDDERSAKDLALQGDTDQIRRRLEANDALQVRAAVLHASAALVASHTTERPRAALQALAQRARRCIGAHADISAIQKEDGRARLYLVDALVALTKAAASLKGGRASLRVVCRDAVQAASIQHKRPDEDYPNNVFWKCAGLWRDVVTRAEDSDALYDALLGAALETLQRLDLRYDERLLEEESMRPKNEFDQELLINLASFCETFVDESDPQLFGPWAALLLRVSADRAAKFERCSSLYRLGALAIRAGTRCDLSVGDEDAFVRSARKFVRDAASRLGDFKDELLECACRVVLTAPLEVRAGQLAILAPAAAAALRLGTAHRPTASRAFDAVSKWRDDSADEFFRDEVLAILLPEIGRYAVAARSSDATQVLDKAKGAQARARARRAALAAARADPHVSDGAARALSRRAVRLLSSCGGEACRAFETTTEVLRLLGAPLVLSLGASAFSTGGRDATLSVRLDGELLERLGSIACGSGPRQTRLLAAEALHALVLVAIGRTTSHPNQNGRGADLQDSVYAVAWPYMCTLSAHSDSIIRALFRELLLQCCRLFSNRDCREQNEKTRTAQRLVDALFDALRGSQARGADISARRASAAEALAEFVNWTCKQMRPAEIKEEMAGAVSGKGFDALAHVLRRVAFDLGQRADAARRLGAALALGKLARHVLTHALVLSRFGLCLLKASLQAVETSNSGGPSAAATRAASAAADRLAEGIRHHVARKQDEAKLLDPTVPNRAPPQSVGVLCDELFLNAAHPDDAVRRRTWYTLAKLAPLVSSDLGSFYRAKLPDQVRARSILWPSLPLNTDDNRSFARAVACVHAVGSFVRAGVIAKDAVTAWAAKGADVLHLACTLVASVGARQRGSAMVDDEAAEDARRVLRRDAVRHSCDLASLLDDIAPVHDLLRIFVDAVVCPDRRGALPAASDDAEVRTSLPLAVAKLLKQCPLPLTRAAITSSLQALAAHWAPNADDSEPTHSSSREDTEEVRLSTFSRSMQRRRGGALRLYDALRSTDALECAAAPGDISRLLARNFFEGLDDDDDDQVLCPLALAVQIGLPLIGEPEAPGLVPLIIKDLKSGEACDRRPEAVYAALVCGASTTLAETWADASERLCRAQQGAFVQAAGDWARSRRPLIPRAALVAPLLNVVADAWPASQRLGLATRLLGAGFRGRDKRLRARSRACASIVDALASSDDASADKAIRLVPHFVGGLTRSAPERRRVVEAGDETDAFDEDEDAGWVVEDDGDVLTALEARLARTLPARAEDWASNEFDEAGRSRARADAAALGAAYGASGAPRLLALLSRRIPALKGVLERPVRRGLRAAATGAAQAAYDNDVDSAVAFLDDLAAHCGVIGKKAPANALNRRSKAWPEVCRFIGQHGLVPALKRFDRKALSAFLKNTRDASDGVSTRPVISLALTALEKAIEPHASESIVATGEAAASILEQAFDGLDGLGRGGLEDVIVDAESQAVLLAYGQDAKALRKRILRLWVNKLKDVTDVNPRIVKSAYHLAVVLAEASQDNPLHLNKILLAPDRSATLLLAVTPEDPIHLTVGCGFDAMQTARGAARKLAGRRDRVGAQRANIAAKNNDDDAGLSQFARTMLRHSSLGLEASLPEADEEDAFSSSHVEEEEDVDVEARPAVEASLWDVDANDPALLEEDTDDSEDEADEPVEVVAHPLNRTPLMAPLVAGLSKLARLEAQAVVDAQRAAKATGASPAALARREGAAPKSAEVLAAHLDASAGSATICLLTLVFNVFVESKGGLRRALRAHTMHLRRSVARATARALCDAPTPGIDHVLRSAARFLVATAPDKRNAPPIADDEAESIAKLAETLCSNVVYASAQDVHYANGPLNPGTNTKTTQRNLALVNALLTSYASTLLDGDVFDWTRPVNALLTPPKEDPKSKVSAHAGRIPRLAGLSLVNAILLLRPNHVTSAHKTLELVVECSHMSHADIHKAGGAVLAACLKATESDKLARDCRDALEKYIGAPAKKAGAHHRHACFSALVSRCTLAVPKFLSRRHALHAKKYLVEIAAEAKSAPQACELLRTLDVGGNNPDCFSSDDELLQALEGILPKALANSERIKSSLPTDEGDPVEDTKTAQPLVQLAALQLLVGRAEALARNEALVAALVHGGPASLEALLAASPDVRVRSLGYDLLAALHDVYFPTPQSKNDKTTARRVRAALIRGLGDADGAGMLDAPRDEAEKLVEEPAPEAHLQETPDEDVVMLDENPNPPPPPKVIDVDEKKEAEAPVRRGVRRRVYDYWRKRLGEAAQTRLDGALSELFAAPDAQPHRFAAFLLLAPATASVAWNQPLNEDLGGDKGKQLDLNLDGRGASLVNAFSVVENARTQRGSSLSTQMFGAGPVQATQKDSLYGATQVDEDDPRTQGRAVRLQTQLLFAADHVVPKPSGDALEDEASRDRRLAQRTVRFGELPPKKKKVQRQKVVMYRSYVKGELPNVGLALADVVRPLMALALRDGPVAACLFGQLVGTLYAARPVAARWRVVLGLEHALKTCAESPTHELGSALHQAHAACIDAADKPDDPAVKLPATAISTSALASGALEAGVAAIEKARLASLTGSSIKGPWERKGRSHPMDAATKDALASLYARVDEDASASLDDGNEGAALMRAGRLQEAFAAFEGDTKRQLDAAKALGDWSSVAVLGDDASSLALAGAFIDDEDIEEKLRSLLKTPEQRNDFIRRAPACVAIRLLRDGDRAGAGEAVDRGFDRVAEALASLSRGSGLVATCVADLGLLGDVDAVARPPSGGSHERWRTTPRPPADAPCASWVASLCARKVLARNDQALEAVLDVSRLDVASLALNANITDVATLVLRKGGFFVEGPAAAGALKLKADYTLAMARDFCMRNEPGKCDQIFKAAHKSTRDLVERGALALEWADARNRGACSAGREAPAVLANSAATDLRNAAIEGSSADAFFAIADLCDEMLRRDAARLKEASDDEDEQPTKRRRDAREVVCDLTLLAGGGAAFTATQRCAASAVETYVRATALDASLARRAIPRVLALLGGPHAEACAAAFLSAAEDAPAAAFRDHGDQLVALLSAYGDSQDGRAQALCAAVQPVVERLARDAPASVRNALRFAGERLADAWPIRAALHACRDDVAEAFVVACEGLHEPEKRLAEGLDVARKAARANDLPRARAAWARLLRTTLAENEWPLVGATIGAENEAYAARGFVRTLRKKGDVLIASEDHLKMAKGLDALRSDVAKQPRKAPRRHCALEKYSRWLRDFDGVSSLLHVPGGRVAGFEPSLEILRSKQVPKRLSVHTCDAQRLDFLVKGGEDLRNDARVEKLFEAIATTLKECGARECRGIGGALRTYAVAPLSPRVGLVEWVPASPPLKAILLKEFGLGDATKGEALWLQAQRARDAALFGPGKGDAATKSKTRKRLRVTAAEASQALFAARKVLDATSGGLRRHLEQLSTSAEAFLTKRRTYAYSLAATCAAGYVVGLGDRHLDNFLLSGDGALVHIDLGYSFGTGALLPVPELIPFRLTRELEAPLEPVGARRVLTAHLETALRTLRQPRARAPLLGLLEAFVREPVLDWLRGAKHAAQLDRDADDVEAGAAATPERRVATARGKLFGANPCHLLNREVAGNPSLDATDASRARHVVAGPKGGARDALRHRATLDVEDQVRVLVEMATDPASLGRHWCGLTLWV